MKEEDGDEIEDANGYIWRVHKSKSRKRYSTYTDTLECPYCETTLDIPYDEAEDRRNADLDFGEGQEEGACPACRKEFWWHFSSLPVYFSDKKEEE